MKPTHRTKPDWPFPVEYYLIDGIFYVKDYEDKLCIAEINNIEDVFNILDEIEEK